MEKLVCRVRTAQVFSAAIAVFAMKTPFAHNIQTVHQLARANQALLGVVLDLVVAWSRQILASRSTVKTEEFV